ncbi:MAG TPA: hypothetical protein VKB34_02495 [Povalibacter sp.]|nr:hypothetical protein [Povalibacter sp.]
MERSYLLLTGALSGLVSLLAHAVIWSIVEMIQPRIRVATASNRQLDVPDILLHLVAGTGLGLLFWLSWGLAAIVDVPWWRRGLIFGSLTWLTVATPAVFSMARARQISFGPALVIATRWATTCLIAGLACAWGWQRAM